MEEHQARTTPTKQEQHQPSTLFTQYFFTLQTRKRRLKISGQTQFIKKEEARSANGTSAFSKPEAPMGMAFPCT